MSEKIVPVDARILVRPDSREERSEGGIIIPNQAQKKSDRGTVVAVGKGHFVEGEYKPLRVNVGDRVLYGRYAGTAVKQDGEDMLIMNWVEVQALLVEE